ncbi:MAG: hypothetical protein MK135_11740 [Polyangiaceae bacterium]|nr:hypothetical protein [Polyangiaceae bacterium]
MTEEHESECGTPGAMHAFQEMIHILEKADSLQAIQRFYAEEAVVFENGVMAFAGREAILDAEKKALAAQPRAPTWKKRSGAFDPLTATSLIEWRIRFCDADGHLLRLDQVSVQRWHQGLVIEERLYDFGLVDEGLAEKAPS